VSKSISKSKWIYNPTVVGDVLFGYVDFECPICENIFSEWIDYYSHFVYEHSIVPSPSKMILLYIYSMIKMGIGRIMFRSKTLLHLPSKELKLELEKWK